LLALLARLILEVAKKGVNAAKGRRNRDIRGKTLLAYVRRALGGSAATR